MNSLVALHRQSFPNDHRSDDEITLEYAKSDPTTFQQVPDAVEDLKRIESAAQSRDLAAEKPGALDYLKQGTGSFMRGAVETVASLPEAIGIGASGMSAWMRKRLGFGLGDEEDPTEQTTYKLGQRIRELAEKVTPDEVPGLEKSFWGTSVPQGLGSAAGFLVGGGAGKAVLGRGLALTGVGKLAMREALAGGASEVAARQLAKSAMWRTAIANGIKDGLPIAGLGATAQGASAWQEAKAAGASDEDAYSVFLWNAGVGTSEVVPLGRMLKRLDKVSGGSFTRAMVDAGVETFEEASQEAIQQFAQNFIAKKYYDKDRNLLEDVADNAEAGGITGAFFSLLTSAIGARLHRKGGDRNGQEEGQGQGQQPVLTPQAEAGINPASAYRLSDEDKATLTALAAREAQGDKSPEFYRQLTDNVQLYPNEGERPERLAFYQSELARLQQGQVPVNPAAAQSTAATAEDLAQAQSEAQPEGSPIVSTPTPQAERGPELTGKEEDTIQAMLDAAIGRLNEREAANAKEEEQQQRAAKTQEYLDQATAAALDAASAHNLDRDQRRLAKAAERAKRQQLPPNAQAAAEGGRFWDLQPEEYGMYVAQKLAARGLPATKPRTEEHWAWVRKALMDGKPVPAEVLARYPDLATAAERGTLAPRVPANEGFTPVDEVDEGVDANLTEVPVEEEEEELPDIATEPTSAPKAPEPTKPTGAKPAEPEAPLWQGFRGVADDLISKVGFGNAELEEGEGGTGLQAAQAYVPTASAEEVYKDARADSDNKAMSRKLGVFIARDGSHVLVASVYKNGGKKLVSTPGAKGIRGQQYSKVTGEHGAYELIGAIKLKDATQSYAETYTPEEWRGVDEQLQAGMEQARGVAALMEEQLAKNQFHNKAQGLQDDVEGKQGIGPNATTEEGEEPVQATVSENTVEIRGFTEEHAGAIYEAVKDSLGAEEADWADELKLALTQSENSHQAMAAVRTAMHAMVRAGIDPRAAYDLFSKQVYDSLQSSNRGGKQAFTKSLISSAGGARHEGAGAGQSQTRSAEPGPSGTGPATSVSGQGTQTGTNAGPQAQAAATAAAPAVAKQIEKAAAQVDTNPTPAQKEAGNYAKGHVTLDGLDITIETPKGAERSGVGPDGKPWKVTMPAHYGYVKGTEGVDGDQVDVYIGPHPESQKVWVIDQIDPKTRKFDEHKAMLGYNTREEALRDYVSAFSDNSGPARIGEMTQMTREDFKDWVNEGTPADGPLAYGKKFKSSPSRLAGVRRMRNRPLTTSDRMEAQTPASSGLPNELLQPDGMVQRADVLVSNKDAVDQVYGEAVQQKERAFQPKPHKPEILPVAAPFRTGMTMDQVLKEVEKMGPWLQKQVATGRWIGAPPNSSIETLDWTLGVTSKQLNSWLHLARVLQGRLDTRFDFLVDDPSGNGAMGEYYPKMVLGPDGPAVASTHPLAGRIQIYWTAHQNPVEMVGTILHEAIHAFTVEQLFRWMSDSKMSAAEEAACEQLSEVYDRAKARVDADDARAAEEGISRKVSEQYGFTNLLEFAAEAMTNRDFQATLMGQFDGKTPKRSLWQSFVAAVKDLIKSLTWDSNIDNTELAAALDSVMQLVELAPTQERAMPPPRARAIPVGADTIRVRKVRTAELGGRGPQFTGDQVTDVSADQEATVLSMRDIAAQNAVLDTLRATYDLWSSRGHNTAGLTFEQFLASNNFAQLEDQPTELITRINQMLSNAKQQTLPADLKVGDIENESMRKRVAAVAHRILDGVWGRMSERRKTAEWNLSARNANNLVDALSRRSAELAQLTSDYTNADVTLQAAKQTVNEQLKLLRASVKAVGEQSFKAGELEQVIDKLEGQMTKPLASQYEKAINRLYARWTKDDGASNTFFDILQKVATLDIDWDMTSVPDIRDTIGLAAVTDPLLGQMTRPEIDSKALLAIVTAFGKSNSHVMDLLQLRRSDALEERVKVNEALKKALEAHKDAIRQARQLMGQLPRLGKVADRLMTRLAKTKREFSDLQDELQRERTFIDYHQETAPRLRLEMAKLEAMIGAVSQEWEAVHGAEYLVPPKATANILEVEASRRKLSLQANGMLRADVRADMRRMAEWLDHVPEAEQGATWGTMKAQLDKLAFSDLNFFHESIQGHWVNRLLAPLTERLRFVGTPAARDAAARLEKMQFWMASRAKEGHLLGVRWEETEGDAMKALGIRNKDAFRQLFYRSALSFIEKRQDILAGEKDNAAAEARALREVKAYFSMDPVIGQLMARPGAWTALERYLKQTAANATWLDNNRREMGLKVLDTDGTYKIYRDSIGAAPFTVIRGLSSAAERIWQAMRGEWGGKALSAEQMSADYATDPKALAATLAGRFTPQVWKDFVGPLVNRTGRSIFYAPALPGDVKVMALRERVLRAYELSGGNPVSFAEWLYKLEGSTGDRAEFVGQTLATFQNFFNVLSESHADIENAQRNHLPIPPRYLVDARRSEEFPAEWLDYHPYDIHSMRQLVKLQSYQTAFGRSMEAMRNSMAVALDEQVKLAQEYQRLAANHRDLTGKALRDAVRADAKAAKLDPVVLENAQRNAQTMRQAESHFSAMLQMNSERPIEIQPWSEIVGTLSGLSVSGPATAFTDTVAVFEQPFRKFGFSQEAFRQLGGTLKSLGAQTYGSLLQAFGQTTGLEADYVKRLNEIGYFDDDAVLRIKDKLRAMVDERTAATNPLMKGMVWASRGARTVLGTGFGHAKEGAPIFPTVKPHSVFTYQSQLIHAAEIIGWWKRYEAMVAKGVEKFAGTPGLSTADHFEFTAKDFGLGQRAFDYLRESMAEYGLSLETVVRDAYQRRQADPKAPLLTREQYRALAMQGQNAVTLESGLSTRPAKFMTDPVLNLANPLLGWAIEKSYDAWRGFREPNGAKSFSAFKTGLLAYAAILPITLAYALMRDDYDEEILGKKQNVLHLTGDNPFLAMLDNAARVGTFGIFGEVPNAIINVDTQRDLSVDSRVFLVNTILNTKNAISTWVRQGTTDYQTVWRPLAQALGGSGYLQYVDGLNNALGLDNEEARIVKRIGVNNYLRAAGRELEMDVRTGRGMTAIPNPIKPYVGQMVLAAYANDPEAFAEAYRNAIMEAREERKPDPKDYVKRSFAAYNPLKYTFRTEPTEPEYARLLSTMTEDGRTAVATAVRLFNGYGRQLGIAPSYGRQAKSGSSFSLDEIRRRSVNY